MTKPLLCFSTYKYTLKTALFHALISALIWILFYALYQYTYTYIIISAYYIILYYATRLIIYTFLFWASQVAGAAAAAGLSLADVAAEAKSASEKVGTMGVALTVCTLPGQVMSDRLGPGKMELGLGIVSFLNKRKKYKIPEKNCSSANLSLVLYPEIGYFWYYFFVVFSSWLEIIPFSFLFFLVLWLFWVDFLSFFLYFLSFT